MTVSPTLMPDFAALPDTPTTFRPPPGLLESPSLMPRGFSISICEKQTLISISGRPLMSPVMSAELLDAGATWRMSAVSDTWSLQSPRAKEKEGAHSVVLGSPCDRAPPLASCTHPELLRG